jgi:LysM repeat protein
MAEASGGSRSSWTPRVIALVALVGALITVFVVIQGSLAIDDEPAQTAETTRSDAGADEDKEGPETPKTYLVEEGDTLTTIAEEFGVSTKRLERLNPDIDPATLNAGQEITLR